MVLCCGVSRTIARVPGVANGVLLKSKWPNKHVWADRCGWRRDEQRRLRGMLHCRIKRSHSLRGKDGSQVTIPAMECAFQVWMARSAALRRWMCGGTRWNDTLYIFLICMLLFC